MSKKKDLGKLITDNKENAEKLSAAHIKVPYDKDKIEKKISKLIFENKQNAKELGAAYKIIATHKKEIEKQAADLISAKKELAHKAELIIVNKELNLQINERKKAEEALKESNEKYSKAFQSSPYSITISRMEDGGFIEVNDAFTMIFGFTKEEVLSNSTIGFDVWVDIEERNSAISALLSGKDVEGKEFQFRKKNGEIMSGLFSAKIISINKEPYIISSVDDITERKRMDDELRKSEEKLNEAMKIAKLGAWEYDVDSDQFKFNDQFYTLLQTTAEQEGGYIMSSMHYAQKFLHKDDIILVSVETQKALETTDPNYYSQMDHRIIRPDGELAYLNVSIRIAKDSQGRTIKAYGVNQDVTERKLAEDALKQREYSYRTLSENLPASVYRLFLRERGKMEFFNDVIEQITGYTKDELKIGEICSIDPFIIPEDKPQVMEIVKNAIKNVSEFEVEYRFKRKEGYISYFYEKGMPIIGEDGKPLYIEGVVFDITERKNAESELIKAKEKAEESDRLKTAFMNNISHEIRTPLNAILGFAPFVIEPNISQEEKEMFLNTLNVSGERLLNTVNDYMDISLIVSNSMEVHSKLVDISLLFSKLYESFKKPCILKNLELKLSLPNDGETYSIKTDEELLHKILSHLVDNAVKFTTKGYVELGFSLNKNLQSNEIEMFVKDSGQGIANDSQKLIFDVFMQENISNTRAHEGSGLGLSIAKGLTKLLGGNIRLESVENEGTTVFVTLPFVESVSSEKTETALHNNIKKKLQTILIAEDDDLNYLYFETTLKGRFSKILWAKNGQEAVDLCHKHPEIDLVLMDIKMPVMNGIEATQQIKSFRKDLPIIAVTAFALAGDEHRFLEAGCDDYISKPFAAKKLIELVSKYLK